MDFGELEKLISDKAKQSFLLEVSNSLAPLRKVVSKHAGLDYEINREIEKLERLIAEKVIDKVVGSTIKKCADRLVDMIQDGDS
jgi:hypothetical protein